MATRKEQGKPWKGGKPLAWRKVKSRGNLEKEKKPSPVEQEEVGETFEKEENPSSLACDVLLENFCGMDTVSWLSERWLENVHCEL